ncbi:leukocyte immunoglobulin-like receptor subfamily A member 6 [Suncus etruscus]|uniref:leukocyte immunoglobulin-like receptor subfamily A member 6 n=1 Tax=Suncus etruscus TaxID=109475 RepID=UPI00210FAA3B|nr:leukocyte immunoglobulin-like receptor subfamily A member 6 [Suncus etruscus]
MCVGTGTPVQTGTFPKPTLWAEPNSLVPSGSSVTFWCQGALETQQFHLDKTGSSSFWDTKLLLDLGDKAKFFVPYITYYCYYKSPTTWSEPSNPLELVVTGLYNKPSLSALSSPVLTAGETLNLQHPSNGLSPATCCSSWSQGWIVTPGQNITLQCHSKFSYDTFALSKEGRQDVPQRPGHHPQTGLSQADFSLGPVSSFHGGQCRCFGGQGLTPLWSEPSDPLDILVAGQLMPTPALSVQPGPSVSPGENVTLLSVSGGKRDTFLLPRCYSSTSRVLYGLSHPRAPLQIRVSGTPKCLDYLGAVGNHQECPQLMWLPSALTPLVKSGKMAQVTDTTVTSQSSRQDEDPHGATYAQVKRTGLRRGVASSPPVSEALLKAQHEGTKEKTQADRQAAAPDAPLEVTSVQLKHLDTAQETTAPPSSLSGKPPAEPTVCASLAFH